MNAIQKFPSVQSDHSALKLKISSLTEDSLKVAKQKAHDRKSKRLNLEKKVKSLELQISSESSEELLQEYHKCKNDLDTIYDYITEGIILRSKVNWYEHGEKSSRYFLNLEKRNKARSFLKKVFISNGTISTDPDEILSAIRTFYSELYKNKSLKP